ncbi:sugar transferase [Microbacterium pseudoresistens]|uniref:Lipopolysaccharide/colanic/teichoic acid biosynthesis glycosyltransferase n=1 Tax=Microbacterium pseudoresistens TaxID=640634 RepID=A0A7Y9EV86_9MICO|nr:sugar transferase [Microbacterium pseudoresistens]NYD54584.1 lipopolysaccharide/colanic/teichoic acid biosynthesis glycosyltransferase [Microbacterium pseudoresistens]
MTGRAYDPWKRGLDVVGALIGLVVLSPVIGVTALCVALRLGRPVVFAQPRPGRNERIFTLYKFRSMKDVDHERGLVSDEQRLTSFGHALRATSLDELPSLWNVLRGDMSFVGPRPLLVEYLARYTPEQARRHEVRPGVTGLAQANGRNALSWDEKFRLDVEYVDRRSLVTDAKVLLATVRSVLVREGISADGHATMTRFTGTKERVDDA